VGQLAFTPDSRWLASCAMDNARRWPLAPAAGEAGVLENLVPQPALCYGIAISPDGTQALRGFGGVKLVSLHGTGGRWLVTEKWPTDYTHDAVAFDASGRLAAAGVSFARPPTRKLLRVWELPEGILKGEWPLLPPGETDSAWGYGAERLAFTADSRLLVGGGGGVRRFDLETGRSEWLWRLDRDCSAAMAVSDDRRVMAAAGIPMNESRGDVWAPVSVFDLATGVRREILSHGNRVVSVALDSRGRVLVTGDATGVVRVGSIDGREPHLLLGHSGPGSTVAVSPDDKWIASASGSEIRLWPMPDVSKPPLHTLPYGELMAKLRSLTNLRVVEDAASATGYKLDIGRFPGWKDVPEW
jgi:WD40 repeat protein